MRVVIDTNVLVSGVMNPHGPPGRIVDGVLAGDFTVLYDDRMMSEYWEVLGRPTFGFNDADIEALLEFVEMTGELERNRSFENAKTRVFGIAGCGRATARMGARSRYPGAGPDATMAVGRHEPSRTAPEAS